MKIACLKNHPVEGPGMIVDWSEERAIAMEVIEADSLEHKDSLHFDALVIMGGPMSVHDRSEDPRVAAVVKVIREAFEDGKPILGICLGAQMLATVAGGEVIAGSQKEIGWYPVEISSSARSVFSGGDEPIVVFHWHGEQIVAPSQAEILAQTDACPVQAFRVGDHQWGLQFHLEVNAKSVEEMVTAFSDELQEGGAGVASASEIREGVLTYSKHCREVLFRFLDLWKESW